MNGTIDHTPATFVIDQRGRESRLYLTEMAYSSVARARLRDRAEHLGAAPRPSPASTARTPSASRPSAGRATRSRCRAPAAERCGSARGSGAHLVLFFDTWETEVTDLSAQLVALNRYQATAMREGLPPLVAIDEGGVEASPRALPRFLHSLPHPLSYPVAVDRSGTRRRRLPRAGLALARARLRLREVPLLRGPRREGLAEAARAAEARTRRADEVKTFRRICTNLPEASADPTRSGEHTRPRRVLKCRPRRKRAAALCDGRAHRREFSFLMRPIRLLILLLAIALTLTFALVRPLQGRATRTAGKRSRPCPRRNSSRDGT